MLRMSRIVLLITWALIGFTWATDFSVPSVSYPTIQSAIDAAATGDHVVLAAQTYQGTGNIDLDFSGKAITVRSIDPRDSAIVAATIIDCAGTSADPHRGFLFESGEGVNAIIDGLTIVNGYASIGGAILCNGAGPTIRNCVFDQNTADIQGGAIAATADSQVGIFNCVISNNQTVNAELGDGGGIHCSASSIVITDSLISGNAAARLGGGILCEQVSDVTMSRCRVENNQAIFGGGIYSTGSEPWLVSCLVQGNRTVNESGHGGGVYCSNGEIRLVNCTVVGNWARYFGGGIRAFTDGFLLIENTIVWDNLVGQDGAGRQIAVSDSAAIYENETELTIRSCVVQGGAINIDALQTIGLTGAGNLSDDPRFAADGVWLDEEWTAGDYQLMVSSPCLNAADSDPLADFDSALVDVDLAGNTRVIGAILDIGAYESTMQPATVELTKAIAKAGKNPATDKFQFLGTLADLGEQDLLNSTSALISLSAYDAEVLSEQITFTSDDLRKGKFNYNGPASGVKKLLLDSNKGKLLLLAQNVDLTGLGGTSMLSLELIGDTTNYYADIALTQTHFNNGKGTPIQFLNGFMDSLRIDPKKVKVKTNSSKPNKDSLILQGELSLLDASIDLASASFAVMWGSSVDATFPMESDDEKSVKISGSKYLYKRGKNNETGVVKLFLLDTSKGIFKLIVDSTTITDTNGDVDFTLQFDNFDQTATVTVN